MMSGAFPFGIYPSLLACDMAGLKEEILRVEREHEAFLKAQGSPLLKGYHIDVMDGHFVKNMAMGPMVVEAIRPHTSLILDVHLMVDPSILADIWPLFAKAGADRVTLHWEGFARQEACLDLLKSIKARGLSPGIAINPATDFNGVPQEVWQAVDRVLVMTVTPGWGGQPFSPKGVEKMQAIHEFLAENRFKVEVQGDGGIQPETFRKIAPYTNDIVVGSYFFKTRPHYRQAFTELFQAFSEGVSPAAKK